MTKTVLSETLDEAIAAVEQLRAKGCHVHSITNTVAQNFTANVLLACGATVSMTANRDEISDFLKSAKALHINLGTIDRERISTIRSAIAEAKELGIPVVLDPVMIHRSEIRSRFAHFVAGHSTLIKGNGHEIRALGSRINIQACVVQTGKTDIVRFSDNELQVENGTPLLDKTIATGCALGALIAALLPMASTPQTAALAGVLWFGVAGEIAAEKADGPGTFSPHFLDALYTVSSQTLSDRARVS